MSKIITIEDVAGGYIVEMQGRTSSKSAYENLENALSRIFELLEERSIRGVGNNYGRVIVQRNRPIDDEAYNVAKNLKHVKGEKVDKVNDVITFNKKPEGAVEKIKAAEKTDE